MYTTVDLKRLQQLLPEAAHLSTSNLQEYALAYVERYQGDVIALEHEWDVLVAAQLQAWQQDAYAVVVRLTTALAYPAGRRSHLMEAEQALQLGMDACRYLGDTQHLASLCNRLGGVTLARGQYEQGQQLWLTGVQLAGSIGMAPCLWEPFASFVYSADILGNYYHTQQYYELLQNTYQRADHESLAVALFIRGFFARTNQRLDEAYEDLSACLRNIQAMTSHASPYQQLFRTVVQAELARVQGDYARAQTYAQTALALAQVYADNYTLGTLLIDQVIFTSRQGQFADTRRAFFHLRELACQMETPHFQERSHFFGQYLIDDEQPQPQRLDGSPTPTDLYEPLSAREREVLRLVAVGLSNRDIAEHLVITPSTVKKHLEHIYTKLDTHNRTSAIAKAQTLKLLF